MQNTTIEIKHCPNCTNKNITVSTRKIHCHLCNFTLYRNVASAVAVVICKGKELLLTKRMKNPSKGLLDLPGGFCDPEETAEQTCQREIREELGIEIDTSKLRYLASLPNTYLYQGILYQTMDLFFSYPLEKEVDFQLEKEEIAAIEWVNKQDIPLEKIAFESQKNFFTQNLI